MTLYGDRLGAFVRNDVHWTLEEELQGAQHPTQFGQVLQDLAIGYIGAHSPQAKGRIERLWETLQDRLVAELRLRRIQTVAAAEAYLPTYLADHNRRFTQHPPPPRPPGAGRRAIWRTANSAARIVQPGLTRHGSSARLGRGVPTQRAGGLLARAARLDGGERNPGSAPSRPPRFRLPPRVGTKTPNKLAGPGPMAGPPVDSPGGMNHRRPISLI